jgi:hypothetical protein
MKDIKIYTQATVSGESKDMHSNKRWVDERVVSELTGRAIQTLRNDRIKGKGIPYTKIGRLVRYDLADLEACMKAGRVETRPL